MAASNSDFTTVNNDSTDSEAAYGTAEKADDTLDWKPNTQQLLIIVTLAIVCLLVALDASIIVTSLSEIIIDLKGDTTEGFWVGTSYLLVNAVTMPVLASISEIFGRPLCLEFSLVMFTAGTVLCSTATGIPVMLAGRSVQGVGGGGIQVLSGVIMTDIVPLRHRPKWYGAVLAAWALGTCVGPIIGGAIAQNTTWRWVFYLMFPICAYGLIAVPLLLRLKPRTESLSQKLKRVDWVGMVLFMGSATSFLVAICWGGTQQPWDSAATIAPLVIGLGGLVVTVLWEIHFASEPILKPSLFHDVSSVATYICGGAQGFLMWSSFYYYPFYFLSVKMTSPVMAGVNLLPAVLIMVPGSVITGRLVTRFDNYRLAIWLGWAFTVASAAVSVAWQFVDVSTAVWVVTFILLGLGHGAVLNAQNFATQAMCREGDEGPRGGHIGAAIGVGVGGTTFQNVMSLKLDWAGLPTAIAHEAEAFLLKLAKLDPQDDLRRRVTDAYIFGFGGVFQVYLGVAAVSLIISLAFIKHFTLNKALTSEHILEGSSTGVSTSKFSWDQQTLKSQRYSGASTPYQGRQMQQDTTASGVAYAPGPATQPHQAQRTADESAQQQETQSGNWQRDVSPMSQHLYPPDH
ncbi:major facilitator superfamily transporter [Apiospora aurea]|uniref:Major facilitator superfamily transporter n=1 Tax=Apiospora aurea TaxID=335848 RepID=A0ABR1QM80_9PEZI